jgi:hypothetical protein
MIRLVSLALLPDETQTKQHSGLMTTSKASQPHSLGKKLKLAAPAASASS